QGGTSETYYVAISSSASLPTAIDGTFTAGSANAEVRLEPIDSVNRLAEDHVGSQGGETAQPASSLTPLFNGTVDTSATNFIPTAPIIATPQQTQQIASLNTSAVPFTLGNVVLFVSQSPYTNASGALQPGDLQTVNPYTGALETDIGPLNPLPPPPGSVITSGDGFHGMAMRNDGELYGLTLGTTDATSGEYDQIDTGIAATTQVGQVGIITRTNAPTGLASQNIGVQIQAMAYVQNGTTRQLFAIGSYPGDPYTPNSAFTNGLYQLDPNTAAVIGGTRMLRGGADPSPNQGAELMPAGVSPPEQITGLASIGSQLYAITNKGGLYLINDPSGSPSLQFIAALKDASGHTINFTSLTAGPPDASNGAYANDLFGVDATGRLYVFNTSGVFQNVLAGGLSSVSLGTTHVTGLAFSTLDYNLWHVTDARATDPGHGVNTAPDNSRNPQSANQPQAGNLSYYFGMEDPNAAGVIDSSTGTSLQPGAANYATNFTTTNGVNGPNNVYGTYNLPGGALGSLQTNSFSLANYNAGDLPTLYFDYYLDSGMTANSTTGWKSSARVMVSADGGKTWEEVATNDPTRTSYNAATDPRTGSLASRQNTQSSELPGFDSASATTPATTLNGVPVVDPRQQVQQLFDGSGEWRQARVDLSNYAGQGNLMLRFDFSSAGALGPVTSGTPGDKFGNYNNPLRGQNNQHEGFYVDDVTVGFAERGEMVTNASANTQYTTTPYVTQYLDPNVPHDPNAPTQNLGGAGPYQLDIRGGTEYGVTVSNASRDISLVHSYDVNDRLTGAFSIMAPAGAALTDGATFQVGDATGHTATFQFHLSTDTTSVAPGNVAVGYLSTSTAAQVAANIAAAINGNTTLVGVSAGTIQNTINGATVVTGSRVNLFGASSLTSPQALVGTLTTSVGSHTLVEGNQATTTVTVSRSGSPANPVSVTVSAFDVVDGKPSNNVQFIDPTTQTLLGSSTTVLIPAGQTSATLTIQERDQTVGGNGPELADGPQKVQIVATAKNYGSNADTLDVVDNSTTVPTLTLSVSQPSNAIITENAGANAAQLTVSRNTPTDVPLVVTLTSLDPASATLPATVTIPKGSVSVTVPVAAVDDNILRTQPVNVAFVASAVNFNSGTTSITVNDDNDSDPKLGTPLWQAVGPTTVTGGRVTNVSDLSGNLTNPVDGAVQTVLAPPASANEPNTLYLGAVNGGIWKTTNANAPGGPTWTPLTDSMPSLSISDLQFGTTNGQFSYNNLIAGVGHVSDFANTGGNLIGVMTSPDGGASWLVITPRNTSAVTPVGQNITSVAERDNVLMAGTAANSNTVGLLRSTDTGGTWVLVSSQANSGLPAGPISDLVGDPIDPKRFYVAVLGQGIFTSDDDGGTWSNVTPTGLVLNANPSGDDIRIADNGTAVYFGYEKFNATTGSTDLAAIYRSPATGLSAATWTAMDLPTTNINGTSYGLNPEGGSDSNAPGGQKIIHFSIAADPTNPNVVYVGGDSLTVFPNSVGSVALTGRLFRGDASRPSGSQWTPITDNYTANHSAPHSDSRGMTFLGGELVEVDDGGIYALSSPTTSTGAWTSLIGNLDVTEIHDVAYDTNTNTVIAGTQDTGTIEQQTSTSTVYNEVNQLNGGAVAVDNSTPGTSIRYISSSQLGGGPGGFQAGTYDANGNLINTTSPALVVTGTNGQTLYQTDPSLPYVTTVVLNSLNPKQMLIGGENAVYESLDGGQTLTSLGVGGAGAGALKGAALAYGGSLNGQADIGVLWIGIGNQVYTRSSQGGTVVATNYSTTAGAGNVRALAIDPTDWQTAVIVDDAGNVWLTTNSGQSFTNITGDLVSSNGTPINLYSVALVPLASTNLIYVGAQDGIYQMQTANPGVWSRYGASMPDVPVLSLEYVAGQQQYLPADQQQQLLVAGTLGRGAYLASAIGAAGDLTITLNQQSVSDDFNATTGSGVISGSVARSGTLGDLPVFIQSSNPTVVPPISVVIPDGQSSANFTIDVNDLQDASGNDVAVPRQTVILTPQAAGTNSIGTYVNISDDGLPTADDNPALTVTLPVNQMNPSLGSTTIIGTVSRNTPTDQPLLVTLVSSDPNRGSVLQANGTDTVLIPAGQSSATFTLTAVDQFVSDGNPEWVSVTAFAVNYQGLGIVSANADGNHDQSFSVEISPTQHLITYNHQGDSNVVPLQGQVIIQDNRISNSLNYGIVVQAAPRDAGGSTPYPGVPMNFQPLNTDGVVPGATITNNLLVGNSQGGINLVGDSNTGNVPTAVVPIARVLNNTIYGAGTPAGVGVNVGVNVSPTILNNIFANLATGVSVDPTSPSTVLEGSVYQNDTTNLTGTVANGGDLLSYPLSATDPLFTNAANNDFYLAPGSKAIDSAINQLNPRSDLATAESLTGIAPSPTVAPAYDLYGQLRTADPQTNPSGVGSTLFKSRGAIESIDFTGPTAVLANPIDNGSEDQDPTLNVVHIVGGPLANFAVQLTDSGTGVDDSTVTSSEFDLYRNGVKLTAGVDYFFQYNTNTKTVYFIPATGSWATGNQYTIYVDNGVKFDALSATTPVGIKDTAGNLLQANSSTGYTQFDILLQQSTGDAPTIGVPPLQTVKENGNITTSLTFSSLSATPNPISIYNIDAPNDTVTAVLTAPNGTLSVAGVKGSGTTTVQFTRSDGSLGTVTVSGSGTGTLTLVGMVSDVNTVLNGFTTPTTPPAPLTFVPTVDFRGPTSITVSVTDKNLGTTGLTGTNAASIEVAPVNQKPVINMPATPFSTTENPATALVITGVSVSDVDYDPTVNGGVEQVTITVPNGIVTLSTISGLTFSQGNRTGSSMVFTGTLANINAALNGMLFLPANNFTGPTTIDISVDDLGNSPAPPATGTGNVQINVTAVNQPPDVIQPVPPVVVNETDQVGVTTVINLSQYISDPDVNNNPPEPAPTLTVVGNSNPTLLSAVINGQILTITYAPYERGS
ncbi:MAG TPA: sialidase family protein, partial [Pirellulales bacterium]|nr:sialidase family protein [Pirellulales bacterium]